MTKTEVVVVAIGIVVKRVIGCIVGVWLIYAGWSLAKTNFILGDLSAFVGICIAGYSIYKFLFVDDV